MLGGDSAVPERKALPASSGWCAQGRDELFPAEQARIVQLLVEPVDVRVQGVEVRLRPNGLPGLVREVAGSRRAAA